VSNEINMTASRTWPGLGGCEELAGLLLRLGHLSIVLFLALAQPAFAQDITTDWIDGERHRARLIAGDVPGATPGTVTAFVEMSMDKGWKTYWRNPGTAGGIPPEFDWSKSKNIAKLEVLFPVPQVLSDKAGDVIGYQEYAIFPLRITPADVTAPVHLELTVNYGICAKLCVPAETAFSLDIPPAPLPLAGPDAARAYAAVPRVGAERRPVDPSDFQVERPADKPGIVRMSALFPGDPASAAMFVSVPDGRYLPLPARQETGSGNATFSAKGGRVTFEMDFMSSPADLEALKGATVSVTMAGEKGQSDDSFVID
jgi:DsbC/DsbD-like thiol-disulfide interchange protein